MIRISFIIKLQPLYHPVKSPPSTRQMRFISRNVSWALFDLVLAARVNGLGAEVSILNFLIQALLPRENSA